MLTRRQLLTAAACAGVLRPPATAASTLQSIPIGVNDWTLKLSNQLEAVEAAGRLGFRAVEVSLGRSEDGRTLPLADGARQREYLQAFEKHGVANGGTRVEMLHVNYLKDPQDKLARKWLADAIPISAKLGAKVLLVPFFGPQALKTQADIEYVGGILRELGPEAERARVVLGLEDTLSAEDNVRLMELSRSTAVQTYYDIGNSTNQGYDILKEIRWLGKDRICQMHWKDNPYFLGKGRINLPAVLEAVGEIGYQGYAHLETSSPSGEVEEDLRRNLKYIRHLIAEMA